MTRRWWTDAEDAILRGEFADTPTATLAKRLGRGTAAIFQRAYSFGLRKSAAYLASPAAGRTNGRQGMGTRFKPGQVPPNKGLRRPGWGPGRMKSTQFKPGALSGKAAQNYRAVGSTRVIDGYLYRKVAAVPDGGVRLNWRPEHHLVWEAAHGPVPKGHVVIFQNGDQMDVRLDNLELITRRDNMKRNSLHNLPPELVSSIQLLGALQRKIRRTHGEEQDQ